MSDDRREALSGIEARIAPHLLKLCHSIDALFRRHVGPIGSDLFEETLARVTGTGHLTSTRGIAVLLHHLSTQIPDASVRPRFIAEAQQLMQDFTPAQRE